MYRVAGQLEQLVPIVERIQRELTALTERVIRLEEREKSSNADGSDIQDRLTRGDTAFEGLRLRVAAVETDQKNIEKGRSRWWDVVLIGVAALVSLIVARFGK